jgi:arylsulfatase A-like enzyme
MMSKKPNILWLTYEDTSPQFVSCYGETGGTVTTPRMDQLAREGVRFDNAYASAPVCSASRSAIITGVCNEALGLGHHRSKYPIPRDEIKGFPWYLQQNGYYTSNNAKTDYNIEDERDFIDTCWHDSSFNGHWRNRPADEPFFSVFNHDASHQSRTMTKPWKWYEKHVLNVLPPKERIDPKDVVMPPIYRDNEEMRRHVSRVYNSLKLCDLNIKSRIEELAADGLLEDTIIFCFSDHGEGIPRGKCNGIAFGYRAAFVVWFPEKFQHLNPWGEGVVTNELISFEDLAPTVLSLTGCEIPAYMTGRPFLGEKREAPRPVIFAARNRLDDTPDLCRSAMDGRFVYTRNYHPHFPVVKFQKYSDVGDILREIRRDYAEGKLNEIQAELVNPTRPLEYLYDLKNDSWEIKNLADDPAFKADLVRLREAALNHSLEMGDVMFMPEQEMVSRAEGSSPYALRQDSSYNPLKEMMAAADLVGRQEAIDKQLALLDSPLDLVRYWAAVGIYAYPYKSSPIPRGLKEKLEAGLNDSLELVKLELAAALIKLAAAQKTEPSAKAVKVMKEGIESSSSLAAHLAMEKVIYLPQAAEYFRKTVRKVQKELSISGGVQNSKNTFPLQEALAIFRYLYDSEALIYEDDLPYEDPETRELDWDTAVIE